MIVGFDMYPQLIFKTGVRIVIDNLLAALRRRYPQHRFVELYPPQHPFATTRHAYGRKIYNHLQRVAWTQVGLPLAARRAGCDVLFCTCYFSPFVQPLPTVSLIYDMAVWRHPEWYPYAWYLMNRLFTELPARMNAHVTTISEDARRDITAYFGLPAERVSNIYLGLDMPEVPPQDDAAVLAQYGIPAGAPYLLYMGPAIAHKNLPALVEAFGIAARRLPEQPLHMIIGGPASNTHGKDALGSIRAAVERAGVSDRVRFTGFVPREHCTVLYRNAAVYGFPSFFEGFGLPMIEAMASGAPVISSDRTSLPEIGGEAAIYFDPGRVESIANALTLVLSQPQLRAEMARRGRERAARFSWDNTADAYMRLFSSLVDRPSNSGRHQPAPPLP